IHKYWVVSEAGSNLYDRLYRPFDSLPSVAKYLGGSVSRWRFVIRAGAGSWPSRCSIRDGVAGRGGSLRQFHTTAARRREEREGETSVQGVTYRGDCVGGG